MPTKTFKYTTYIVSIIEKVIGSNFSVTGLENLPKDNPIMFVSNHFTRSETLFVPYLINKYAKIQVRSLAHSSLFKGILGRILTNSGTVSTSDPDRNKIIISDLINNQYNWLIYPEGGMVKNKNINKGQFYSSQTVDDIAPVKTGSAVLALKSQLYRRDIIYANKNSNSELLKFFKQEYDCAYNDSLENYTTYIVPLTVSYYPLRPGRNLLERFAKKRVPNNVSEELEIEGNLLSSARINIHFNKAINLQEYIKLKRQFVYQIPIIGNETKSNIITKYFKYNLTTEFMTSIYKNIRINFDHIFSASIRFLSKEETVSIDKLKRVIFLSAYMIKKVKRFRCGYSVNDEIMMKLFCDEDHDEFDSALNLSEKLGEIQILKDNKIRIDQKRLNEQIDFHSARINNTMQVIFNEFRLLIHATNIVKKTATIHDNILKIKTRDILLKQDQKIYLAEYEKYRGNELSKPFNQGKPFLGLPFLLGKRRNKKFSILLCHGYKSSPKEMENLSKFLNNQGFCTYCVRMAGHGTNPMNIQDITWQDWDLSFQRGYAILKNITENVIVIGFSTGGLISLLNGSRKKSSLSSIIAINPAIRLQDIRSIFASTVDRWNNLLGKFNIKKGSLQYVESNPEDPVINYSRNYLKGVVELKKLMEKCDNSLKDIEAPTLLIQASSDPVVNPKGANIIYNKISSKNKFLSEPNFDNHIIINGKRKEEVFEIILNFLKKRNFCK